MAEVAWAHLALSGLTLLDLPRLHLRLRTGWVPMMTFQLKMQPAAAGVSLLQMQVWTGVGALAGWSLTHHPLVAAVMDADGWVWVAVGQHPAACLSVGAGTWYGEWTGSSSVERRRRQHGDASWGGTSSQLGKGCGKHGACWTCGATRGCLVDSCQE